MATFDSIQTGNIHIDQGDRTEKNLSPLALDRVQYKPRYPDCLEDPSRITVGCFCFDLRRSLDFYDNTTFKDVDRPLIENYFPNIVRFPLMKFTKCVLALGDDM